MWERGGIQERHSVRGLVRVGRCMEIIVFEIISLARQIPTLGGVEAVESRSEGYTLEVERARESEPIGRRAVVMTVRTRESQHRTRGNQGLVPGIYSSRQKKPVR